MVSTVVLAQERNEDLTISSITILQRKHFLLSNFNTLDQVVRDRKEL